MITDELRKWAKEHMSRNSILSIADRIDKAHEEECRDEYSKGHNDGFDEGFASADDWLAQHEDAMAEHGWVRLPVDADGEYINIGDRMQVCDNGAVFNVTLLRLINSGWVVNPVNFVPSNLRHYHAPTVEDVLREFGDWYAHTKGGCDEAGIIAEYAAKLQLKEDE